MAKNKPKIAQTMDPQVNTRKWTTKVNLAVVIAVVVVFLIGAGFAVYMAVNPGEVHDDLDREGVRAPANP